MKKQNDDTNKRCNLYLKQENKVNNYYINKKNRFKNCINESINKFNKNYHYMHINNLRNYKY